MKRSQSFKQLILACMAVALLVSFNGCVVTKKEIYHLEKKTSEIQADLDRLRKEIEESLEFVGRPDGNYDYNSSLFVDSHLLDQVIASLITLETQTVFETRESFQRVTRSASGLGLVTGRHVLTLDHVVTQSDLEITTPFGRARLPSKKLEEKTFLVSEDRKVPLKKVLRDSGLDVALFEIPPDDLSLASLPCPVGDSNELTVGTFVYIVGNPFNSGINVREGIVSSLFGMEGLEGISTESGDLFMISNGVAPGDSGAPVLALRDGVPELVGIVQGTLGSSRIGWAVKIVPIMRKLSGYLDQEELQLVRKNRPLL